MRIILSIFLILILWATPASTQTASCYQQLSGLSGTEFTASQLSDLEQAACDLIDSLPQAYQDSFAVLDYGFYLHNRSMDQGVEDVWQEVIQEADAISPYYLLLGRVPGREGEVKVGVKLPGGSFFSCFDAQKKNYFESVNSHIGIDNMSDLVAILISTMEKLTYEIEELEACCVENLKSETCVLCPENIYEFRGFLESNGFISAPLSSITYSENVQQSGVVQSLYDITATLPDGTTLDINHDVETYLNAIAAKVEGIEGNIAHYDPANLNCTDVLEWVNGIPSVALQDKPNTSTKSKTAKSSQDRYLLKMDVITTEDAGGNVEVHMRSSEDLGDLPECEVGTIFLINIDDPILYLNKVRSHLDSFWTLLLEDYSNIERPYVINVDHIDVNQLKDLDAISIIGYEPSNVVKYVDSHHFYEVSSNSFRNHGYCSLATRGSLEMGDTGPPGMLSITSTKIVREEWEDKRQVIPIYGFDKTISMLIFHANGHNAGWRHRGLYDSFGGYMMSGHWLSASLTTYDETFEDLINSVKNREKLIKAILEPTIDRFIKR